MKRTFLFTLFLSAFAACTQAPKSDEATTSESKEVTQKAESGDNWTVDPAASRIRWIGTKVSGFHVGSITIKSGELKVKDGAVTGGKFIMDMKSLAVVGPGGSDAGANKKLEGHLTSPDFFDVEKYPEAVFEITSVKPFTGALPEDNDPRQADISEYKVSNPTHTVSGNLTIKDITKNIEFPAKIMVKDNTVDALAKFNIDRSQWGITYPGKPDDLIRNEIHMGISLKANK